MKFFKVGDKVFLYDISVLNTTLSKKPSNVIGIIKEIKKSNYILPIIVLWSNGRESNYQEKDLLPLKDKQLSDYREEIITLAKERDWLPANDDFIEPYPLNGNILIKTDYLGLYNDLRYTKNKTDEELGKWIKEIINVHCPHGEGEILIRNH